MKKIRFISKKAFFFGNYLLIFEDIMLSSRNVVIFRQGMNCTHIVQTLHLDTATSLFNKVIVLMFDKQKCLETA